MKLIKRIKPLSILTLFAIFSILVMSSPTWATTYYVDATNGIDNNNGLSPVTAWKTIAQVNSYSFSPGDSILFKKGETWRETLTIPSSGSSASIITFSAYGTGAAPIISGSDLITAGWSQESTNIWKSTVTTEPKIIYFNGTRGTRVAATANITSEFNWFWATNILYVWSPSDNDPSLYYTIPGIEAGNRQTALRTNNNSYITIDGLTLRDGNRTPYFTVVVGFQTVVGVVIQNCTIERGVSSGIIISGQTTATSYTINNCTIQNNGGRGIFTDTLFSAATMSNNTITGNGWRSVTDSQQYDGIAGALGNVNIFGNTIYDNGDDCSTPGWCHGIYPKASTAVANIYENKIYSNGGGGGIRTRGSINAYRNLIYDNYGAGVQIADNEATDIVCTIYDNIIHDNNRSDSFGGIVENDKGAGSISLTVDNNTLYNNANTSQLEIKLVDDIDVFTMFNNILFASSTRRTFGSPTLTGAVNIDYNLHWRADGNPSIIYAGEGVTWEQWRALGFDTHGVNANPRFISTSTPDFSLQSTSPAINAGANLNSGYDHGVSPSSSWPSSVTTIDQNLWGSGWEIGAYVYSPMSLNPPTGIRILK